MKASFVRKIGDWECINCPSDKYGKTINFASRTVCIKCNRKKPINNGVNAHNEAIGKPEIKFRKGDWYCSVCNDHQFEKNQTCRKCNTPKPVITAPNIVAEDDGRNYECVVCMAAPKDTGFLHGETLHLACCKGCAVLLRNCPLCRMAIEQRVTVYF